MAKCAVSPVSLTNLYKTGAASLWISKLFVIIPPKVKQINLTDKL